MNKPQTTLTAFLSQSLAGKPLAAELQHLLLTIADTTKEIAGMTARGALAEVTGKLESQNVQGETQMQLDVLTNDAFIRDLTKSGVVAGLASEEMDMPIEVTAGGKFIVVFDPLDGSSNVAVNVSVGSIFSVLKAPENRPPVNDADYLLAGKQQLAAGYAIYGPATMLVLTTGDGTHGFTLDPATQEYILTHAHIQVPEKTSEFAINASNERFWEAPVQRYVAACKLGVLGVRGRDFNMRWVASMVADVHRILMRGGVYLYPRDNKQPPKAGRLRLMYEANPMSMLIEQAGGKSSTGRQRIMDVEPTDVHQRVPVLIGSSQEVNLLERYHREFDTGKEPKEYAPLFSERSLFRNTQ